MKLVAAALVSCLLLGFGQSASVRYNSGLRKEFCSWGAQYWCSGPKTAGLCGKAEWCANHHWNRKVVDDTPCSMVHDLIKQARRRIASLDQTPESDFEIAKLFAKGCSSIKEQNDRQLCKEIVTNHEHLPKLVELITSKLPIQSVAEAVGVCKREAPKQKVQPESCITCEDVVTFTQKYAHNHLSLDVFQGMFKSQCHKLGPASKMCQNAALENYKEFYHRLILLEPSSVCKTQKRCVSQTGHLSPINPSDAVCDTCKTVVADIRSMDRDENVQSAVRGLLNETCKYLGEFEKLCMVMVDEGLEYVFEIIATEMEPEVVCEKLNLCHSVGKNSEELLGVEEPNFQVQCSLCKLVMGEISKMLLTNKTEEAILKILDEVCTRLPPSMSPECEALLDQYKPEIIKILTQALNPTALCTELGLCKPGMFEAQTSVKGVRARQASDEDCFICEFVVKVLDDILIANETEETLIKLLDVICDRLPGDLSSECNRFVKIYSPQLIALIVSKLRAEQICAILHLCPVPSKDDAVQTQASADPECALCKFLIDYLKPKLKKNATKEELFAYLKLFCSEQPLQIQQSCTNFLLRYGPAMVQLLVQGVDPDTVCTRIGLCRSGLDDLKFLSEDVAETPDSNGQLCDLCKYLISYLDKYLLQNSTEEELEKFLDGFCDMIPSELKGICDNLVKRYGPTLVKLLVQGLDPNLACTKVGLCKGQMLSENTAVVPKIKKTEICAACESLLQEVEDLLDQNATRTEIVAALQNICNLFSGSIKDECNQAIALYTGYVIDLIEKELPPQLICQFLKLCGNETTPVLKATSEEVCGICKMVVTELDKLLQDNSTLAGAEQGLKQVCNLLPKSVEATCKEFVDKYTPFILQLVASQINPTEFCTLFGLCAKSRTNQIISEAVKVESRIDGAECELCKVIISALDEMLGANATKEDVKAALEKVCSIIPAGLKAQCDAFVSEYASYVIDIIVSDLKPEAVCEKLKLCSAGKLHLKDEHTLLMKTEANDEYCTLCVIMFETLEKILPENSTKEEIISALDKVCDLIPDNIKGQCKSMVRIYLPYVIDLIITELPPKQICKALGVCTEGSSVHRVMAAKFKQAATDKGEPGPFCIECEQLLSELQRDLKDPAFVQKIEAYIDSVCTGLPGLADTCKQLVHENLPSVIKLLLAYTPDQLCALAHLCDDDKATQVLAVTGTQCELCKFLVTQLDKYLASNSTQQEIEQVLQQLCNSLPASLKQDCETLVNQYEPLILELLLQMTPDQVCSFLTLCPGTVKTVTGTQCELCKFLVTQLDKYLASNSTQQEIEQVLQQLCNSLPASLKQDCETLVNQYEPLILEFLLQMTPDQVCSFLTLCPGTVKTVTGPQCELCEFLVTQLDNYLAKNSTQQQIEKALEDFCNSVPADWKEDCDALVQEYGPVVLYFVLQMKPDQVCSFLKLCPETVKTASSPVSDGPLCPICEFVMTQLDNLLASNSTQQQIEKFLEQVCTLLPESVRQQCDSFIEAYTPQILQLLLSQKPAELCSLLGLCPSSVEQNSVSAVSPPVSDGPLCPICEFVMTQLENLLASNSTEQQIEKFLEQVCTLLQESVRQQCDSFIEAFTPQILQLLLSQKPAELCSLLGLCPSSVEQNSVSAVGPPVTDGPLCVLCEYVMSKLETILGENATKQDIEKALDVVCSLLPSSIRKECDKFVAQYTPELIQLLLQAKPSQVCSLLGICKKTTAGIHGTQFNGFQCTLCKFLVGQLEGLLANNGTQQQLEQALEQVCASLPEDIRKDCDEFIEQYIPRLMEILLSFKAEDICTALAICSNDTLTDPEPVEDSAMCVVCEAVVKELENVVGSNATEEKIKDFLDKACTFVPPNLTEQCNQLIATFTPEVLDLLLKINPNQWCSALNVCQKSSVKVTISKKEAECIICTFVMDQLEELLTEDATQEKIAEALDRVACNAFPAHLHELCHDFMSKHTPDIVRLLLFFKPKEICYQLKLCPKKPDVTPSASVSVATNAVAGGPQCPICEFVIEQLDLSLKNNATQAEIEAALEKVCSLLPATVKQECDNLVAQYTPALIHYLLQYKPEQVCTLMGLCTNSTKLSVPTDGPSCVLCEFIMHQLQGILSDNATKAQIEAALDKVCNLLPASVKQECDNLVAQYTPALIHYLLQYKPEQVCTLIGLCTNSTKLSVPTDGPSCVLCEFIMHQLQGILSDNATKAQIELALDLVCNLLPASLKTKCGEFIEENTDEIIELLVSVKPQMICTYLGVCETSNKKPVHSEVKGGQFCTICEFVLTQLDNMLADNATQAQIEAALDKVCNLLPASVKQECDNLVAQYTPQLVQYLLQYKPEQVCTLMGLCTNSTKKLAHNEVKGGQFCTICEFVLTQLDNILADNATQAQIEAALDTVCNLLPSSVKQECDNLVAQYTPALIQYLLQYKPEQVCTLMGLCTNSTQRLVHSEVKGGQFCTICEFVLVQLDNMLADNATQAQIEAALDKVCSLLPASVKQECDNLVAQYTPQLVQYLLQYKPEQVCTLMGLCTKSTKKLAHNEVKGGQFCTICEFVVTQLDNILADNATQAQIEAALDTVCNLLPSSVKQECDNLVAQYTPALIQYLLQYKPEQVCTLMGLCTNSTQRLVHSEVKGGQFCTICEFVLTQLDNMLADNATQAQIEAALDKVCSLLPASVKQECDNLVAQYTPQLVQYLLQYKPEQVCTLMGLCTKSTKKLAHNEVKGGQFCTICEFVVTQLDNILADNATQAQIEAALDTVCNLLPSSVKQECDNLVAQYTPALIQYLLQYKPEQVCTLMGLCTNSTQRLVHSEVKGGQFCTICEFVLTQLDNMLADNATQAQIEAALDKVCSLLPASVKQECDNLVAQYTPQLVQYLLQYKPEQVCTLMGLCTKSTKKLAHNEVKGGQFCTICEFVVTQLDNILADNATQAQIEAALDTVCNLLPSSVKQECDNLVAQYTPALIQYLLQYKPEQVCTLMGLCTNSTQRLVHSEVKGGQFCTICEFVLTQLDNMLADNATQAQIEAALDKVCSLLPASVKQECDNLVAQYTPQLVQYLLQYKPEQVCTLMGLCTKSTKKLAHNEVKGGQFCTICEFVVTQLDNILADNATQAQIEAALDTVCNLLPSSVKQECDNLVAQYTPALIQYLLQYKPEQVCTLMGLCTNSTQRLVHSEVKGGQFCTICEFVLTQLDNMLADNATQAQIEAALDKVCSLLPASVKQECDNLVAQYTPQLVQYLLQYKPEQVCTLMGLCTNSTKKIAHNEVKGGQFCTICEFVVTQLDNILADNATQAQIEAALDTVCNLLPSSVKQECDNLVAQYTPALIQYLLQYKPEQVCTLMGLCTNSTQRLVHSEVKGGQFCTICEFVLVQLDNMLADNATQAQIEAALDKVCSLLPASVKQECENLVAQYTPQLVQYLLQYKPEQVCTLMGLCTKSTKKLAHNEVKGGQFCTICEFVVTQLDNILADNATQAQIEAALDTVCNLLPSSVKQECDNLVAQYTPALIQYLLQYKPEQVCTLMGLCTNSTQRLVHSEVKGGQFCTICEFVLVQLDNMLADNATQAQIEAALDKVCSLLPASVKQECDNLVAQYTPQLVQYLLQYKPEQVCTLMGLCTNSTKKLSHNEVKGGQFCTICEFVVTQLDNILADNATQAQIEAALDTVCNLLPSSVKQECDNLVAQYTPALIQYLLQYKPEQVCTLMGLCTNSTQRLVHSEVKGGQFCTICEFVLTQLDNMLADNATQAQIEAALDQVCNLLPASVKQECDNLVAQYTPQLVQYLLQYKPEQVCTLIGLCTNSTQRLDSSKDALEPCLLCKVIMIQLEDMIGSNATQDQIKASLKQVCGYLPASLKQECGDFVSHHFDQLVQLLLKVKPAQVCDSLGLCSQKISEPAVDTSLECIICNLIMTQLENLLNDSKTQADIEFALEKVCGLLPGELRNNCIGFIEDFAPEIVEALLQVTPEQACAFIKVCPPTAKAEVKATSDKSDLCDFCEYVIQYLDDVLKDNATREEIRTVVNDLCLLLPAEVKATCEKFLEDYAETVIDYLAQQLDPKGLCTSAGLCNDHGSEEVSDWPEMNANEYCEVCEEIAGVLEQILGSNYTEVTIELALNGVCSLLPSVEKQCERIVAEYTPEIIDALLTFTPKQLCTAIKLCTDSKTVDDKPKSLQFVPESDQSSGSEKMPIAFHPYCSSCKFLSFYLQTSMKDPFWKTTAKNSLYEFCNQLQYEKGVCRLLMDMNADTVLSAANGFNFPEGFCQDINLCEPRYGTTKQGLGHRASDTAMLKSLSLGAATSYPHCTSCKSLTSKLTGAVEQQFWKDQVKTTLDQICELMTYGKGVCKHVVEKNIDHIIQTVGSSGWPEETCEAINLCEAPTESPSSGETACELCEKISETAQVFLKSGASSKRVQAYLEMVCASNTDSTQKEQCLTVVKQYLPMLIHILASEESPLTACQDPYLKEAWQFMCGTRMTALEC